MLLSTCCNKGVWSTGGGIYRCVSCGQVNTSIFSTDCNQIISTGPVRFQYMVRLGKREEAFGTELLQPIAVTTEQEYRVGPANVIFAEPDGRPRGWRIQEGQRVIAGYDEGAGEHLVVCQNLNDLAQVYNAYSRGDIMQPHWYVGPDPGFLTIIAPQEAPNDAKDSTS